MVALLALASMAELDGQAAAERAEAILHKIGVQDSLALSGLSKGDWASKEPSWVVSFSSAHGSGFVGINARTGSVNRLQVQDSRSKAPKSNRPPTPADSQLTGRILRTLGYGKGLDVNSDVGFSGGGPFHLLVHGLPFFNLNPNYGPTVSAYDAAAPTIIFYAPPPLPPINAWRPKVEGRIAAEKIRTWAHARAQARHLPAVVDPSVGALTPELGYWKGAQDPVAHLVWRATKYTRIEGRPYGLGALRMFVDALTGELIEPDDPAWGMNP